MIKISIITVCFNSEKTIQETIDSVNSQDYSNIEYIIIDGNSIDNTNEIIKKNINKVDKSVSEKDNGLYDAINKGIAISSGEIIGILNSDDTFTSTNVVSKISKYFGNTSIDVLFADVSFVNNNYKKQRVYSSKSWKPNLLKFGFMPAHPTFYCRTYIYKKYGGYKSNYKIAADFEFIARLFNGNNNISYVYVPNILIQMKIGGISTKGIKSKIIIIWEIMKACKANGIKTNYFLLYSKYFIKGLLHINYILKSFFYEKK